MLCRALGRREHDFFLANFANADMVGHTGVIPAVIKAVETVDRALTQVLAAAEAVGAAGADHRRPRQRRDDD
ncbi:MAG: hypothetical protein V9E87_04615 [Gemmatimonadales bacterium]